ncbi:Anthranilate synthase component 2 [Commensalibacter sp. Nvir]|uniref:anthranilate synthase component II n=1 Tax=Commensalibacter sp. Nvir TaxID=3069817 RepID=UPI002D36E999|nr:Anthranilate synthase component 2 [Commensalibacter sp. Nvir]
MILLIDNYDSFTYNLVQYFGDLGYTCDIHRNDTLTVQEACNFKPEAIVISPGPCSPSEAGICCDLIKETCDKIPILGVCLGHQAIGQALGAKVKKTNPAHGKISSIKHNEKNIFEGLPNPLNVTRYHSLTVDAHTLPIELIPTAYTDDGVLMALEHTIFPVYGVQFHPESIASEKGHELLNNFMKLANRFNKH